jgi:hypothetical protein
MILTGQDRVYLYGSSVWAVESVVGRMRVETLWMPVDGGLFRADRVRSQSLTEVSNETFFRRRLQTCLSSQSGQVDASPAGEAKTQSVSAQGPVLGQS